MFDIFIGKPACSHVEIQQAGFPINMSNIETPSGIYVSRTYIGMMHGHGK